MISDRYISIQIASKIARMSQLTAQNKMSALWFAEEEMFFFEREVKIPDLLHQKYDHNLFLIMLLSKSLQKTYTKIFEATTTHLQTRHRGIMPSHNNALLVRSEGITEPPAFWHTGSTHPVRRALTVGTFSILCYHHWTVKIHLQNRDPQDCWQACDDVDHMFAGRPQEEGTMQESSSFPWLQNQVYRISRTWRRLTKVSTVPEKRYCRRADVDLHTITNKLLCPNETERLSISPTC